MPDGMCAAIRFSGLEADGAPRIAAAGHRRVLTGLLPAIRSVAAGLAAAPGADASGPHPRLRRLPRRIGPFNTVWLPQARDTRASAGLGPVSARAAGTAGPGAERPARASMTEGGLHTP